MGEVGVVVEGAVGEVVGNEVVVCCGEGRGLLLLLDGVLPRPLL